MNTPTQVWLCAAHHPAFRCGGWAWIRLDRGQVSGAAGGERNTTAQRMALAGLAAALRGLSPGPGGRDGNSVSIRMTGADIAGLNDILTGGAAPDEDLDLWAQIATAAKTWRIDLAGIPLRPDTPAAFADAWASLAMDKAKATGAFTAAIPKANLAKARGLDASPT